jgi:hypothetical protein
MQWFKHDTDAAQDAKIKKLILKYGAVGYAVYFHCLELIASDISETNLTFELEHDSEIIADNLKIQGTIDQSPIAVTEEVMRYIVDLGLFEKVDNRITCIKLSKRLDSSMSGNPRFRAILAANKYKKVDSHDCVMTDHDTVMTESCKIRLEENRREEKREEETRGREDFPLPLDSHDEDDLTLSPSNRLDTSIKTWNNTAGLPRYRYSPLTMPHEARTSALNTLQAYTDEEITGAILNYATVFNHRESYDTKALYSSGFSGFMAKGVPQYCDEAKPIETMRIRKPGEYIDPERERIMEAAKKQADKYLSLDDDDDEELVPFSIAGELAKKMRVTA